MSSPPLWDDPSFVPVWARTTPKAAQNLLASSPVPIEYDHRDLDYSDNCFFFPEDCSAPPTPGPLEHEDYSDEPLSDSEDEPDCDLDLDLDLDDDDDVMAPLPTVKMLDTVALTDLLADNLALPEISSIFIFAANGAVFAHASSLPQRRMRSLTATYGAAYASYAYKKATGNLTGVSSHIHPSAFASTPSVPLAAGDVGSIMIELADTVAVVTRIADKVLLAVVGPTVLPPPPPPPPVVPSPAPSSSSAIATTGQSSSSTRQIAGSSASDSETLRPDIPDLKLASSAPSGSLSHEAQIKAELQADADAIEQSLRAQWAIDRRHDLERLANLNLSAPPHLLLALESKSAALGRFLSNKLADLESPEDF